VGLGAEGVAALARERALLRDLEEFAAGEDVGQARELGRVARALLKQPGGLGLGVGVGWAASG